MIGAISLHNPWGQKLLEGMRTPPTLVELWLRNVSSTQKTEGRYVPTYEELVRGKVIASGFLREEELKFVEEYCQGKIR